MRDKIMDEHRSERPTLQSLREEITRTDEEMARLFVRRMEISKRIGALKTELGLPVFDPAREEENLRAAASRVAPSGSPITGHFFRPAWTFPRLVRRNRKRRNHE